MNKIAKNASWIIICKIIQAVLALIINMLTARFLGPSNYGLLTYAASLVAFVVPLMNLGFGNILVQEIVNDPNREGEYLGTSISLSVISALLCIIGVTTFAYVANPDEPITTSVCLLYSVLLIFQAVELIQYWFQAKLLSKYTSIISLVAYVIVSGFKFFLLVTQKSVQWFAISNALDYCLISLGAVIAYRKLGGKKLKFSWKTAAYMFSKSKHYIVSSMMVTVFAQTDKIMLKLMINEAATGYYGAAVQCASLTSFVFVAIIDSFRPSIFESKKNDVARFELKLAMLYSLIIYLSLAQSIVMAIGAPLIIGILYGDLYSSAVSALRIVVWYTTFSYLGSVRNIWILAFQKQKYLWIINLSGALTNIIINGLLIPILGIDGAAIASLITQLFTNVLVGYILQPIRDNNRIMIRGLNPKYLFVIKKLAFNK